MMPPGSLPLPLPLPAPPAPKRQQRGKPALVHLLPALLLVFSLLGLMAYDFFAKEPEETRGKGLGVHFDPCKRNQLADTITPQIEVFLSAI